ncbi:hypothetical protein, partial [Streptomyces leeuwenhoekii]
MARWLAEPSDALRARRGPAGRPGAPVARWDADPSLALRARRGVGAGAVSSVAAAGDSWLAEPCAAVRV